MSGDLHGRRGIRHAAILLLTLPEELASELMSKLDKTQMEAVASEISEIGNVERSQQDEVTGTFLREEAALTERVRGGFELATTILQQVPGASARDVLTNLRKKYDQRPFAFLHHLDPDVVVQLLKDEHPQCIAVILNYLPPGMASHILARLTTKRQIEVVRRIADMEAVSSNATAALEAAVQRRLETDRSAAQKHAGLFRAAEIMSAVDRSTASALFEHLTVEAPELAKQMQRLTIQFDQLNAVSDAELRLILRKVEIPVWAVALKGCSDTLRERVQQHLTDDDLHSLELNEERLASAASATEVEEAQLDVVRSIFRMRNEGQILASRADEDEHFRADRPEAA